MSLISGLFGSGEKESDKSDEVILTIESETDVSEAVKGIPGYEELKTAEKMVDELFDFVGFAADIFGAVTRIKEKKIDYSTALNKIHDIREYIDKEVDPKVIGFASDYDAWSSKIEYVIPICFSPAPYLAGTIRLENALEGLENKLLED